MVLITTQGKAAALAALAIRRARNRGAEVDNASFPAGSPMFFPCVGCGVLLPHPEDYLRRRALCDECAAMKACGWLE